MSIQHLTSTAAWQLAGWTMLHYLWFGGLVTLVAAALRLAMRRAAANVRYAVLLVMLGLLAAGPLGIAAWLASRQSVPVPPAAGLAAHWPIKKETTKGAMGTGTMGRMKGTTEPVVDRPITITSNAGKNLAGRIAPKTGKNSATILKTQIPANPATTTNENRPLAWSTARTALPWLATGLPWLWIVGAPLSFALLASGLIGIERLRRDSQPLAGGPIPQTCQRLARALGLARPVAVALCDRLRGPVLVGVVRPLILLPPAAVCGWSPEQIEMVLLHELAHIRRHDNLVNLLQRTVEGLLFFQPAVWLLSHWVRLEREASCDRLVVAHTGRPRQYAQLLLTLAEAARGDRPALATAMATPPLAGRIRRILKLEDEKMLVSRRTVAMVTLGLLVSVMLVACYRPGRSEAETAGAKAGHRSAAVAAPKSQTGQRKSVEQTGHAHRQGIPTVKKESQPARNPHFLSLEDQRQADLAYKLLGLELEPLSKDELGRVRAMGFDGGLRVTMVLDRSTGIQLGDLLVGLHVWTTGSLQEIGKLLLRPDLAKFVPLKLYAIRKVDVSAGGGGRGGYGGRGGFGGGGYGGRLTDSLVTGRITVNFDTPPKENLPTDSGNESQSKSVLRYDGKSFGQWQQQWRTELNPERRIEAIRALATFGRYGFGQAAAEAILDVAGEYDFREIDSSPEGKLKDTVIEVLGQASSSHLPATDWLPALQRRIEENPAKWRDITVYLFDQFRTTRPAIMGRLDKLARHADPVIRRTALAAMRNSDPQLNDPLVQAAMRRALAASDPEDIIHALQLIKPDANTLGMLFDSGRIKTSYASKLQPEIYPLLFRTDIQKIHTTARQLLPYLEPKAKQEMVDRLLQVIQDATRNKLDHLAAIYALAELGVEAQKAKPVLEKLIEQEDPSLTKAATKAIKKIEAGAPHAPIGGRSRGGMGME